MRVEDVLRAAVRTVTVAEGETIFRAGEAGDEMFGIIAGSVRLTRGLDVVAELGAGEVFGEMALIDASSRTANAVATSDATLAVIDQQSFVALVEQRPTFALDVMRTLVERLRQR